MVNNLWIWYLMKGNHDWSHTWLSSQLTRYLIKISYKDDEAGCTPCQKHLLHTSLNSWLCFFVEFCFKTSLHYTLLKPLQSVLALVIVRLSDLLSLSVSSQDWNIFQRQEIPKPFVFLIFVCNLCRHVKSLDDSIIFCTLSKHWLYGNANCLRKIG